MENTSNKTIMKNTLFLYIRMALVTIVGLYTARVILQKLGVEDFGIYTVAGSAVALFSFLSGALGNASSRFITVEIGKVYNNDISSLVHCFKTTRAIHAILAGVILIICETIGLWVLLKANIPEPRQVAAMWAFQISVLTAMFNVTQVPFTALIIAHEKMSIYAYVSVFEVILKLAICYLLVYSPIDKLVWYALLLFIVQISILLYYRLYCRRVFKECELGYELNESFFKPIMSFSFWNLFGSLSSTLLIQGATLVISFFFGPVVVASRAIANQVKSHVLSFVNNVRVAMNPQIIKRHAAGEEGSSRRLIFLSTNITYYLMLFFILPLFLEARFVLELWLEEVPEYTVEFTRLVLLELLFCVYDVSFYQIFQSEGRLKENAIICPVLDIIGIAIVALLYYLGGGVLIIGWCMIILSFLQGVIIKPYLAIKLFGYNSKDFIKVYCNNIVVTLVSLVIPCALYYVVENNVLNSMLVVLVSMFAVVVASFLLGFNKQEKEKVFLLLKARLNKQYR